MSKALYTLKQIAKNKDPISFHFFKDQDNKNKIKKDALLHFHADCQTKTPAPFLSLKINTIKNTMNMLPRLDPRTVFVKGLGIS